MKRIAGKRNYRLIKRAKDPIGGAGGQKVYVLLRSAAAGSMDSGLFEGVFSSKELAMEYAETLTYGISLDKQFEIVDPTLDNGDAGYNIVAKFLQSELGLPTSSSIRGEPPDLTEPGMDEDWARRRDEEEGEAMIQEQDPLSEGMTKKWERSYF